MITNARFFVYLLASRKYGAIYVGVTGNLPKRIYIHREALIPGFSSRYKTYRLVYFEQHADPRSAITREKQIKKWRREWNIALIEENNPDWDDLYDEQLLPSTEASHTTRSFPRKRESPFCGGLRHAGHRLLLRGG